MTGVRSARILNLALPIRGFNTELPPHLLPEEFSPWLVNFDSQGYYFKARPGIFPKLYTASNFVSGIVAHPTNVNKLLFVDTWNVSKRLYEYDITTDTNTLITTLAGANNTAQVLSFNYERNSFFFYPNSAPSIYDGSSFTTMSITGPTAANIIGGCVYRNRLYLFESNSGSLWYAELPRNIGGTFIEFPATGAIQQSGVINCAFAVTTSNTALPETYLGVYFNTGEVVLFRGSYPGSADWVVAGTFNIGTPLGIQSYISVEGDIWLLTFGGITSVRQLIGGVTRNKITANISRYWEEVIKNVSERDAATFATNDPPLSSIRGAYHQGLRKVIITIPGYLYLDTSQGTLTFSYDSESSSFLTYDVEAEAWIPAYSNALLPNSDNESFITPYYWSNQNKMYLGSNSTSKEAGYVYWDEEFNFLEDYPLASYLDGIAYDLMLQTAFTKSPYTGKANGVFASHEGAVHVKRSSEIKYSIDFGATKTPFQGISQTTPSQLTRDLYNVQAQGNSFSIEYQAEASGQGYYNLYGFELIKEEGRGIS